MNRHRTVVIVLALLAALLAAPAEAGKKKKGREEPVTVVVQHILITFKGSRAQKEVARSKRSAEKLAYELLERAQQGEEFDALVKEYTDDKYPGIYAMSNRGKGKAPGGVNREDMVPEFGDVAFELEVGEVGIARYSAGGSPFGYHVIKRLE